MADTSTSVSGKVSVQSDCKERVAFDLMREISLREETDKNAPRRYWLELYYECLSVVHYNEPSSNLQERPKRG